MKKTISICAGLLIVGASLTRAISPPIAPDNAFYESQHAASSAARGVQARARQADRAKLVRFGMEPDTCGFHIIDPERSNSYASSGAHGGALFVKWDWWSVVAAYPNATPAEYGFTSPSVVVSTSRVFPNGVATLSKVPAATRWDLTATFSDRGLGVVDDVHGPQFSATRFTDWYGKQYVNGGQSTPMKAALVFDGIALLPFSVTSLVGLSGPQTVVVAEAISEEEADSIIAKFNN